MRQVRTRAPKVPEPGVRRLLGVLVWCAVAALAPCGRSESEDVAAAAGSSADALLDGVLLRFPRDPLTLSGQLFVRLPRGIPVRDYAFDMTLDYGADPAVASYAIRSSAGRDPIETLTVKRTAAGGVEYAYAVGDPLVPVRLTNLSARVQQTDLTWLDLSLSFLWWRGGLVVGSESVRGRPAIVADVAPPAGGSNEPYARVRLWIDEQARILLQAEGYDAAGKAVRTLWVKSFKKIDERWMIKDLEVQEYPAVHRTKLRIDDVQGSAPGAATGTEP